MLAWAALCCLATVMGLPDDLLGNMLSDMEAHCERPTEEYLPRTNPSSPASRMQMLPRRVAEAISILLHAARAKEVAFARWRASLQSSSTMPVGSTLSTFHDAALGKVKVGPFHFQCNLCMISIISRKKIVGNACFGN